MKTPTIQEKQPQENQNASFDTVSEGMSLAPPVFQLEASEDAQQPSSPATGFVTVTNGNALLRGGPPEFKSLETTIAPGTRVVILEEQGTGKSAYVRVKDYDTGAELGWTWKNNTENLDQKYQNSNASYTYHVDGHDLVVFLPKDGIKQASVNVFMFFHGWGGDYTTTRTHAKNGGYDDNPAISGNIAGAVSNAGCIAICPQANQFKSNADWAKIAAGGYQNMVTSTLAHLSKDLGRTDDPLTAGNISLTGHSGGGAALGQAALDTGATDVTLQEAGYNFLDSWKKLREWFLLGQGPKTMRLITVNNAMGQKTRKPVANGGHFSKAQIVSYSKQLVKENKLPGPVTVEEFEGDGKVEDGDIVLERGYRVLRSDGSLQGSLRLYHLADSKADHWAAASQTMETSMTSGETDRADDEAWMKKR